MRAACGGRSGASDQCGEDRRQFDGAVALHAVARTVDDVDDHVGSATARLGDVAVVDHRRQRSAYQGDRTPDGTEVVPQRRQCARRGVGLRIRSRPGPVGTCDGLGAACPGVAATVVAPLPGTVRPSAGVVEDPSTQRRLRTRRVVLLRAGEQFVETGELLGPVDEIGDRLGLRGIHARGDVDHDEGPDQRRVPYRELHRREPAE
jgi:hypothetical protein